MKNFIVYNSLTGDIVMTGLAGDPLVQGQGQPNLSSIEGKSNLNKEYIDLVDFSIKSKISMNLTVDKLTITADDVDKATISGIPLGVEYTAPDGTLLIINDGFLEFTSDVIDTFVLIFKKTQHLTEEISLDAI